MKNDHIIISKARVHNLQDVSVKIPKNTLTVITGPSGSGKSSLAFDTIYVEGQRRYIESLSSYARQFLGQHNPPEVESITGLSPAIAIDQKTSSKNPRSTVGTITEIYDYMRVLFARIGTLYSPDNGEIVRKYTPHQIAKEIKKHKVGTKIFILAKIKDITQENFMAEVSKFLGLGFARCRINKQILELSEIDKKIYKKNFIFEIVIDRLILKDDSDKRLIDSIEQALKMGEGHVTIVIDEKNYSYSEKNMAPNSDIEYPELEPKLFSFNSATGACEHCHGLGEMKTFDMNLMMGNTEKPLFHGAVVPLEKTVGYLNKMIKNIAKQEKIPLSKPYQELPESFKKTLFYGSDKNYSHQIKSQNSHFEFSKPFPGVVKWFEKKYFETASEKIKKELEKFMRITECPHCDGKRLNPIALSTVINGKNIHDLCQLPIDELLEWFKTINLDGEKKVISEKLVKEIFNRIKFLNDVGLNYLTLNRQANTLSGGEAQRIRLATQIGSALSGVLYVLDEPSIGLHQKDNGKLIMTLKHLRDIGNTVIVVEHDEETIAAADYIVDMGPEAGVNGGKVIGEGNFDIIKKNTNSLTSDYLNRKKEVAIPKERKVSKKFLTLTSATYNNLKNIDVSIPLHSLVAITGVSGSGKSSLIHHILVPAIKAHFARGANRIIYKKTNFKKITGLNHIKSIIEIDQSPIGRTPHSNPATYTGLFDLVRDLYAKIPESKMRGYKAGRFSFNVKGGRCEECEGNGVKKIEMHFLPDIYITCSECNGTRYNRETLSILYKGKNIADVLKMTIREARDFFENHPKMSRILNTMCEVGLGYMALGQSATTLSGGEAQRLKLSTELAKSIKGECLYVLDEPTTGLHFHDVKILLDAINKLVELGHSVIVIEHNLDIIKSSDYVIDMGPEGGDKGGKIVAIGTPEEIAKNKHSHTGQYLKKILSTSHNLSIKML